MIKSDFNIDKTGKVIIIAGIIVVVLAMLLLFTFLPGLGFNNQVDDNVLGNWGLLVWGFAGTLFVLGGIFVISGILNKQAESITNQNKSLQKIESALAELTHQQYLNTVEDLFLRLLRVYKETIKNIKGEMEYGSVKYSELTGSEYFYHAIRKLKFDFAEKSKTNRSILTITFQAVENGEISQKHKEELKDFTLSVYDKFLKEQKSSLNCYFTTFRTILIFIRRKSKDAEQQKYLLDMLSLHISHEEMGLLFYNELKNNGSSEGIYSWLDECGFFSKIDEECLIQPGIQYRFYPKTEFEFLKLEK